MQPPPEVEVPGSKPGDWVMNIRSDLARQECNRWAWTVQVSRCAENNGSIGFAGPEERPASHLTSLPSGVATQSDPKAGLQQPEKRALKLAPDCICRLMHEAEAAEVTVPFADVGARLGDVLAKHGTAIVADVLSQTDVADLERVLQLDLEELVDGDAVAAADASVQAAWQRACDEGVAGWPAASLADVGGRGRFQDRGMPHGRFAWGARLHPKVRHVYEVLHGTSDLVPSCDNSFVANASESEAVKNRCASAACAAPVPMHTSSPPPHTPLWRSTPTPTPAPTPTGGTPGTDIVVTGLFWWGALRGPR